MSELALDQELEQKELACVVIPTGSDTLLLPNVCVAEIVKTKAIKAVDQGPPWLTGITGWRGQTICVVDIAGFDGGDGQVECQGQVTQSAMHRCLVVMNRSRVPEAPAFYGLLATSLPRILQLTAADMKNQSDTLGNADAMKVLVGTELATIPDLEFVERNLQRLQAQLQLD